ncbi:MAG: DUF1674 domain-containing protein [Cardiobacteriaceae bacterium]|nr:DUF1674 domain-containing protein [Cardiobacteriaceae bacterium]
MTTDTDTANLQNAEELAANSENFSAQEDVQANQNPRKSAFMEEEMPKEIGGRDGLEPTRYGDWEYKGRCIDF